MGCTIDTFHDYLAKCTSEITVYAQLSPLTTYSWIITDKFGNKYSREFDTDSNGFWEIDVVYLPEGLLSQYGGGYVLEVQGSNCKPVKFKIASEYDRIEFDLHGGNYEKNNLGCDFTCQGVSGSASTIITYTGEDEKIISYTAGMLSSYGNAPQVSVYSLVSGTTYELIAAPVTQTFTDGVLTSITVDNLTGLTGYIIIS